MRIEPSESYDRIAEFYDLDHDHLVDDVAMYIQFVETVGGPVLEMACGSGRIAVPLARRGFPVVGIDTSPAMLNLARQRVNESMPQAAFLEADMTALPDTIGGPFGVVIMALGALAHLETQDHQQRAIQAAYKMLDPRGLLLIDILHATPHTLSGFDGSVSMDGSWQLANGDTVERFSTHEARPAHQQIESRIWYDVTSADGTLRRRSMAMTQRYVSPGELLLMLASAGFEEVVLYGDYELGSFVDDSERLIVAAEVSASARDGS